MCGFYCLSFGIAEQCTYEETRRSDLLFYALFSTFKRKSGYGLRMTLFDSLRIKYQQLYTEHEVIF